MPLYLDIHDLHGPANIDDLAKAHAADLEVQEKYGVNYLKYWVNKGRGKVFCLVDAPNAEAANQVHKEAHGLVAEKIIEVEPEVADGFLGGGEINAAGAALMPGAPAAGPDPAIRTILFTDIVESTALTQSIGDEAAMKMDAACADLMKASRFKASGPYCRYPEGVRESGTSSRWLRNSAADPLKASAFCASITGLNCVGVRQ